MSDIILCSILVLIMFVAWKKKINAYGSFISGVKEGLFLFYDIFPSLLAMLCAINLFKVSGLMDVCAGFIHSLIPFFPKDLAAMSIFRSFSGSASLACLKEVFVNHHPDSFIGMLASMIQGSSETTFYVVTLYFSSVGIKKTKNALGFGLLADLINVIVAIILAFCLL